MKHLALLFVLISSTAFAEEKNPEGSWSGSIELPNLRMGINVQLTKADPWTATIDIPAQGLTGFALSDVKIDADRVQFAMKGIPGNPAFDGKLADDGKSISGDFTQGAIAAKFSLKRKVAKPDHGTKSNADKKTKVGVSLDQRLERLASKLEERRQEFGIPGVALAVVKDDKVILSRGFGVANKENQTPVTPETLFAIGSSTKAFTATVIGMLIDDGKMSWDDPVTRHLPAFKLAVDSEDEEAEATIRDLLSHRSGFTRMGMIWAAGKVSRDEILEVATKAEPWAEFRKGFHYCNVTYLAAGQAAAVAAESTWDEIIAKRIFAPLGMSGSTTFYEVAQKDPRLSKGYTATENQTQLPMRNIDSIGPAGSINSNAVDMAKWLRFQLNNGDLDSQRLISEEQFLETRSPQIAIGGGVDYGLGWMLREIDGHRLVEHGGNIDGFGAQVGLFPDDNLGFVLLTNVSASPLQALSNNMVAEAILGNWSESSKTLSAEALEPFTGEYVANFGAFKNAIFKVAEKKGKLTVDVPGQMAYELKPPNDEGKWLFALTDTIAVSFDHKDEKQPASSMTMYQAGVELVMPRKAGDEKKGDATPDDDLPTAEEILTLRDGPGRGRNFENFDSFRVKGDVRSVHSGVTGKFSRQTIDADKTRYELNLGRFGKENSIIDGDRGWQESDFEPSKELKGKLLAQAKVQSQIPLQGDWSKQFDKVNVLRAETYKKRKTYVVELLIDELPPVIVSVDAETGDLLKLVTHVVSSDSAMEIPIKINFEKHRDEDGVRMPWRSISSNDMTGRVIAEVTSVETNPDIDAKLFELP